SVFSEIYFEGKEMMSEEGNKVRKERRWLHPMSMQAFVYCPNTQSLWMIIQGDPVSSFLFIIMVEALRVTNQGAKAKRFFEGVKVGDNDVDLSYFQFALDALLLGKLSLDNARNLCRILRFFNMASDLKVNFSKCKIIGILALVTPTEPIIENPKRLSDWKARSLLYDRILILIKLILGTLGTYYFSLFKNRLPTRFNLDRRGIDLNFVGSPVCDGDEEEEEAKVAKASEDMKLSIMKDDKRKGKLVEDNGKGKEAEHHHLKVNKGSVEVDLARAIKANLIDDHDLDTLDLENRIKKVEEDFSRLLKAKKAKESKKAKKAREAELAKKAKGA
nr:hypothetical protein [Tanacetum cinerariifolium]